MINALVGWCTISSSSILYLHPLHPSIHTQVAALLALITLDYTDFGLILFMLLVNGFIGFYEEYKAQVTLTYLPN